MKRAIRRERVVGFSQAQRSFIALLHLVKRGYAFRIKRRGRPDARLDLATFKPLSR
jgi:hypothetical protein